MDYHGKCVVITGGATGIGFGLAKRLGRAGAKIVIGEPRQEKLDEAVNALGDMEIEARAFSMDVTDPDSVKTFADFAENAFGGADVLINNAGVGSGGMRSMTKLPLEDLRRLFDVNFFGVWQCAAEFGRRMIERGTPAEIYNLGSENSFFNAVPKTAAYIASKHAVRGLTESMREDFPDFIRVGLICPGFVQSEMTKGPVGELAMPTDELVEKVYQQMQEGAFYIVSHAYNIERIRPIHEEVEAAYARYAPRYSGDEEYDVKTIIARSR